MISATSRWTLQITTLETRFRVRTLIRHKKKPQYLTRLSRITEAASTHNTGRFIHRTITDETHFCKLHVGRLNLAILYNNPKDNALHYNVIRVRSI